MGERLQYYVYGPSVNLFIPSLHVFLPTTCKKLPADGAFCCKVKERFKVAGKKCDIL